MIAATTVHWALAADWLWVIVVTAVVYAVGLRRASRAGQSHGWFQAVAFYASLVAMTGAFVTPIDTYDNVSFLDHMVQHLILMFVVAPLFALGAPIALAMKALPPRFRDRILMPLVRNPVVSFFSHPLPAAVLFFAVQGVVMIVPLFNGALNNGAPHFVQHALLLATAFIFWRAMAGIEPPRREIDDLTRLGLSMLLAVVVGMLGVAIVVAKSPLYPHYATLPHPWGGRYALESQKEAGWLLLLGGVPLAFAAAWLVERVRATGGLVA